MKAIIILGACVFLLSMLNKRSQKVEWGDAVLQSAANAFYVILGICILLAVAIMIGLHMIGLH